MELLKVEHLTFSYPNRETPALRDVSFSVQAGDFFVLLGPSGSGKTTLLRQLKPQLTPHGTTDGRVLLDGSALTALPLKKTAAAIGFVQQHPQDQIVTDTVWHELAFGAESLGMDPAWIRRRVAETAAFFGLEPLFRKQPHTLSGGQLQLLNLAAAMVLQPELLLLDEPTAQLDPIAAQTFFSMLERVNRELGVTILMTEHRLEEVLPRATQAAVLENGALLCCGTTQEIGALLKEKRHPLFAAMPAAMQVWGGVDSEDPCPVSVREGRAFLKNYLATREPRPVPTEKPGGGATAVLAEDLVFSYEETPVLQNCSFTAQFGALTCILGGNGAGKSTLLALLAGRLHPAQGDIHCSGTVGLLPQEPQTLFLKPTLQEDLLDAIADSTETAAEKEQRVQAMLKTCCLSGLENRHPFDLAGGEQQRAALAKVLLTRPEILLLDEPTKGFDAAFKLQFAVLLKRLTAQGVCVLMVSHDVEFCARYADWCALLFDGGITCEGPPQTFFSENRFYTTQAARMAQDLLPDVVTTAQLLAALGGTPVVPEALPQERPPERPAAPSVQPLPRWRKRCAGISALGALVCALLLARRSDFSGLADLSVFTQLDKTQWWLGGGCLLGLILLAVFTARRQPQAALPKREKLPLRTWIGVAAAVLLIPAVLWFGTAVLDTRQYYITALLVLVLAMLPFFLIFEGRRPKARELALLATLCALAVAGRAAFFMLPQCKPVLAITILAGVALGGESGFLVGAVTMLLSNLLFGQGAWTPWQMFAMGLVGFLAGLLARLGLLQKRRVPLCVFGALSAIVIYGGIMNPVAALLWGSETLDGSILLAYYATGLPMDGIHALATALFLWFLAPPMLETLDRVRAKYGIFS